MQPGNLKHFGMSQKSENKRVGDVKVVLSNASDKRRAWKNSGTTAAAASEHDSLLTNSVDDRLTVSFDSRQESKQAREANQSPADLLSNLLRVPSPSRRSGFYSTSPSTDEGIGTEDHFPDENVGRSSFDKTSAIEGQSSKLDDQQVTVFNGKQNKRHFSEKSSFALSSSTRSSKSVYVVRKLSIIYSISFARKKLQFLDSLKVDY